MRMQLSMSKLAFIIGKVWDRVEKFFLHLASDVVMIILTVLALWIVGYVIDHFFPFEPETLKLMKSMSEWGILVLFALYIIKDIWKVVNEMKPGGSHE